MPDRAIEWATHGRIHLGPKRLFIIVAGSLGILRGLAYIDPPPVPDGLSTLGGVAPLGVWGWAWVAAGIIALLAVWSRRYALALTPLLVLSALWGFSYGAEWGVTVLFRDGESREWITGISYAFQAASILLVSRLVDPTEVRPEVADA